MNTLILIAMLVAATPAAFAQLSDVQRAAATVAHLHDTMLDPASFVLDGAYVTKTSKRGSISICYSFRSHNTMGGYSAERAVEDGDDHNRLSVFDRDNGLGRYVGYDVGWFAPCKDRSIDRDITAEVAALATPLYRKNK